MVLVGLVTTGLVLLASGAAQRAAAQDPTPTPGALPHTIAVIGVGETSGTPDTAFVQLGVEIRDPDINAALAQTNDLMTGVMTALTGQGIAADDIQTTSYNIYQELYGQPMPPEPMPSDTTEGTEAAGQNLGVYVVSNIVQIKVRDIEQVGAIIQAALDAGANRVYGLTFGLEDTTELENQARQEAADNARQRAEALASAFGVTLGDAISIAEGGAAVPPYLASAAFDMGGRGGGPTISEGQLTVSVQVTVTYAITP